MDGVLIDSEPLWQEAEIEVFSSVGVPMTRAMAEQSTGLRMDLVAAHWFSAFPWTSESPSSVAERVKRRVAELIAQRGQPIPGAVALVRALRAAGVRLALCSSSARFLIDEVVRALAIADCFEVLLTAEDCVSGKPDPEPYLATAAALGLMPRQCVVIEDSINGMRSASAAGAWVVGYAAAPSPEARALCRRVIGHFGELPLETLLADLAALSD